MADPARASLERFLAVHLGVWPPPLGAIEVVGSGRRDRPAWDGRIQPLQGVVSPEGGVLSVPFDRVDAVRDAVGGRGPSELRAEYRAVAAAVMGRRALIAEAVFRWCQGPAGFADAGVWLPAGDPVVPEWLRPFGGEALVALEDGRYVAGVGLKRHDPAGEEIAVGTEEWARGRGLARRLVAQAARRVQGEGRAVTYLHAFDNLASARVAEAAGFPDRGWTALAVAGMG